MSTTVCIGANTIDYPSGGGHLWVYMNWALGFRSLGCRVLWLEGIRQTPTRPAAALRALVVGLKLRLARYGLADGLALLSWTEEPVPAAVGEGCLDVDAAAEADLFLNLQYAAPAQLVRRFRKSALLDIDPGLLQTWMAGGMPVARHDTYFTTGETVGRPGSLIPDVGLNWVHVPPCVALDYWTPCGAPVPGTAFTTISHWASHEWVGDAETGYDNEKSIGFAPFLDLPKRSRQRLELALCLGDDRQEVQGELMSRAWSVRDAYDVASTPWDYQSYIRGSKGEFSCVKPSCIRMQNAWVSDRTICYLASGRPTVVQHTGPSRFLPEREGMLRFRDIDEAAACLELAAGDYPRQGAMARALAEEYFDARKVARRVLERAL